MGRLKMRSLCLSTLGLLVACAGSELEPTTGLLDMGTSPPLDSGQHTQDAIATNADLGLDAGLNDPDSSLDGAADIGSTDSTMRPTLPDAGASADVAPGVNPCSVDNGGCDANARCEGSPDGVICICNPGFVGDGQRCERLGDCADNNGGCGPVDRFLCIPQPGAEPTCRAFTLADLWSGDARFSLDDAQDQIAWNGFHFLSTLWDAGTLYAYSITNYSADGIGRSAVGLAVSEDGETFDGRGVVLDIGGAWQWTFEAADDEHHQVGRAEEDGWAAGVDAGDPAYLAFGPYARLPAGPMTVSFQLMVDVIDAGDDVVVTLDIFDATAEQILATRDVTRHEFGAPFEYRFFNMDYVQEEGHVLEYRVFWHRRSYVRLGVRAVSQGTAPFPDQRLASFPGVWKEGDTWYLVYECAGLTERWPGDVCLSTSSDGLTWIKAPSNPILVHQPNSWEENNIGTPSLWVENGTWYLYYHGFDGQSVQIGLASGPSLNALQRHPQNPLLRVGEDAWDAGTVGKRSIIREGAWFYMAYEGSSRQAFNPNSASPDCQADRSPNNPNCIDFGGANWSTGLARSPDLINWTKFPQNPVLPSTMRSFGYDGAEFIRTPDTLLHLYYRAPAPNNQTKRATLKRAP